jgi:hypothetical protein
MKVNHNFTAVNHVPLKASNLLKSIYSKRCATNRKTTAKELIGPIQALQNRKNKP